MEMLLDCPVSQPQVSPVKCDLFCQERCHPTRGEETGPALVAPFNFNKYATIKSMAEGMLDVTLLMSNAKQLALVINQGPEYKFYIPLTVLICLCLLIQIVIFLFLIFIAKTNVNEVEKQKKLNLWNIIVTFLIGTTLFLNVFITALMPGKKDITLT
ncbi:ninjurin-2-like isoform X1 [Hypanus sabinus]|uniref:ninjurin-2-like isoform X1 n=1 Tax=Hypanus sabinus TaxID=79690 RepID=UPI0028C4ED64|nr:ninjurin-2-like isoform X1 [Hypanus sabinus]XP_059834021.1 ninjurin-2-like isoform X1 [Hypanus sabinus]XP_059834022.1 ninjurin-2-like isoform X1 [Hypanus sabinus]XP_059834023.1 ninjurin-2-like isoform X1 [Hypanus sabinus]XP_059834024.1 ninjurin-2-like isoform X1 [Hypanus sabinus]XP_059834025.1 ninjurin-2-like isoform X1 [Hypanus sabinus]XP_059834026.1 ninjurin-2-like isoform X1 [Hypanus sabinus]XP_059834029.1 ninjurin-2-like isoform X1 [Hypanus sabinus]XP_059834030.1 ninjurin-2-like isof